MTVSISEYSEQKDWSRWDWHPGTRSDVCSDDMTASAHSL